MQRHVHHLLRLRSEAGGPRTAARVSQLCVVRRQGHPRIRTFSVKVPADVSRLASCGCMLGVRQIADRQQISGTVSTRVDVNGQGLGHCTLLANIF